MKGVNINRIMSRGKAMFLAYDQGLEHGPIEFNDRNVDPRKIIEIAKKGKFSAVIFQKGIVEKYQNEIKKSKVPLIIKLKGKTNMRKGDPVSRQICSVSEALRLGAIAVGYTIYAGSEFEPLMMKEFARIEEEAHKKGITLIAWIYPRGRSVKGRKDSELMAYAGRMGLEIGADIVKLHYDRNKKDLAWTVKSAGKTKVVIAGGIKTGEKEFLSEVKDIIAAGGAGIAVGRNIWKSKDPIGLSKKVHKIIFGK